MALRNILTQEDEQLRKHSRKVEKFRRANITV